MIDSGRGIGAAVRSHVTGDAGEELVLRMARGLSDADAQLERGGVQVILLCVDSDRSGIGEAAHLRRRHRRVPIVVVADTDRHAAELLSRGAQEILLVDELDAAGILRAIHCAIDRIALELSNPDVVDTPLLFGDFELDPVRLELRERGQPVRIHPTPLRLLIHLIGNADRTVSKEELLEHVWSGTLVSDFAISSALKELRHVLHDDGVRQRYVQTLRGCGYRFVASAATRIETGHRAKIESIAVLPLQDLSSGPDRAHFAAGMTEALIASLVQIRSLRVISRTSVMVYDGSRALRDAAAELGVDGIVTGTVTRDRKRVRVTAQLLSAEDESLVWADHFDQPLTDLLDVQNAIARSIAGEIALELTPTERAQLSSSKAMTAEALDAYLLGRFHLRQYNPASVRKAKRDYERAIEQAPDHAASYAGLASALLAQCGDLHLIPRDDAIPKATVAIGRALELDPRLGEAHAIHGAILGFYEWQWAEAEMAFRHAVELSPGDPDCLMGLAKLTAAFGSTAEAVDLGRRALRADPLNLPLRLNFARLLWWARRVEDAAAEQVRVVEMDPALSVAYADLGTSYMSLGRPDEAVEAWLRVLKIEGFRPELQLELLRSYDEGGMPLYWKAWVEHAREWAGDFRLPESWLWAPYAVVGDLDRSFEWLEKEAERRSESLAYVEVDAHFDPLRGDRRFDALRRRVGLPHSV
jgi:TolB-like protein/cytochrome c-type biogenesis protein CcmH/NrfG